MATFLYRLGFGSYRHRAAVVGVWLLLLVAAGVGAATLSGKTVDTFRIPGQESTTALDILGQKFGSGAERRHRAGGAGGAGRPDGHQRPGRGEGGQHGGPAAEAQRRGQRDRPARPQGAGGLGRQAGRVQHGDLRRCSRRRSPYTQRAALIGTVQAARDAGLTAEVAGQASVPPAEVGGATEGIGVVVALVVLVVTFGSLVAAGMTLLTALVGVAIGALGIITLTGFVDLQSTTPILALMLGLAVGIDYALFIFSRYRQELLRGPGRRRGRRPRGRHRRLGRGLRRPHRGHRAGRAGRWSASRS